MTNIVNEEEVVAITTTAKPIQESPKDKALDSIYDHYQKKLYVIDRSGSMDGGMLPEDEMLMYKWTPEILDLFRDKIVEELEAEIAAMALDPDADPDELKAATAELTATQIVVADDKQLMEMIIKFQLIFKYGIDVPRDWNYARTTESKMEAVRGAMKKFVEMRFQRFPDAQVGVFGFGSQTELMAYAGNDKQTVLQAIERLSANMGGTNIFHAVEKAMKEMKARPSRVKAHHIVLVTDAQDYGAIECEKLLPDMKKLNVVFDFILVLGQDGGPTNQDDEPVKTLKRICQETGGEYNEVRKSTDFEQKFLNVSNRKALPPAKA